MQELQTKSVLEGYTDQEKGAYLGAIASLATADRSATEEELQHIRDLAEDAGLSPEQTDSVVRAASELSGEELKRCLDILKTSNLRFSLVTDLIAFAEADGAYSQEERENVQKITEYLGIDKTQYSLLDQFVHRSAETNRSPEEIAKPGFLESLGLKDQFAKAGINVNSLGKGLLGFLGPMLIGGMMGRMSRGRAGSTGGLSGGGIP
ncbi:MAG TPA: TerB family tellurite resistance protein, partial [Sphingobacteriaceae bacterium]